VTSSIPRPRQHPFLAYSGTPTDGYFWSLVYWSLEGEPDRMDADLNGVPCETLYDPDVVAQVLAAGPLCRAQIVRTSVAGSPRRPAGPDDLERAAAVVPSSRRAATFAEPISDVGGDRTRVSKALPMDRTSVISR